MASVRFSDTKAAVCFNDDTNLECHAVVFDGTDTLTTPGTTLEVNAGDTTETTLTAFSTTAAWFASSLLGITKRIAMC
jgi:hypothetical protein